MDYKNASEVTFKETDGLKLPDGATIYKGVQGSYVYPDPKTEGLRYNPGRLQNRIKADGSYDKNEILPFPLHVIIETTSICNFAGGGKAPNPKGGCKFCNLMTMTRPEMHMKFDIYEKVVRECAEWGVYSLSLYALGEPFLQPKIREMVVLAKQLGIPYVDISTNASYDMRKILGSGLDELIISIDGMKETHEKMRGGANWDKIVKNVKDLCEAKRAGNYAKPLLRLQCIRFEETEKDVQEWLDFWTPYADVLYLKNMEAMAQNLGDSVLPQTVIDARMAQRVPCKQLWFVLTINPHPSDPATPEKGGAWVSYCCHDSKGKSILGDLSKHTIKECWDSQLEFREKHRLGEYSELCKGCVDFWW